MTRIAVVGAGGRMGRQLVKAVLKENRCSLTVATCRKNSTLTGMDTGEMYTGGGWW